MSKIDDLGELLLNSIVSVSSFNHGDTKKIFNELQTEGIKIVCRNSTPIGVIISPKKYKELIDYKRKYEELTKK